MFKASTGNSSQHELLSRCFCDHVSPNVNKLWLLLLCYLRVRFQLASPPGFHFNTSRRGTLNTCINVFFSPFGTFFSSGRGSFLVLSCSRLRGTQGAGPELERKFGPWPTSVARDLGFKVVRPLAEGFRARRPSTPRQTHVQVKRMSDVSCDIWDLECHQCRQAILGDGKVFPPHQHARHATTFNTIR